MRRVRRKGGNKEKVFGCDLVEHLAASSQDIPLVLRCCSEFVEKNGIVDGIYRLSGVSSNIQKLRCEFESDGNPELNKDLYLQDIHCVSSLCKAYFRELPNPLLTYQLYDKFADAVAIQLEEERLVKIRDVLKELPAQHYRTLKVLMRHLVKMASYSAETNMHARNLAIVWAPNLLRSKDIETSGFNGTAAFMEVRVQSIVVEFILTHVPQLFPEEGVSHERRKSLPSPSAASGQEEGPFKFAPSQPVPNFGHISPGDGPLPIRPYHAIIEGTDKRKGSLKGRKWMSIFNIGGRFHDPRRRHKHSAKEKDRPALRPARSMDSLSPSSYPNEGSRRTAQHPPPTNIPTCSPSPHSGSDAMISTSAVGGSEYAVTYRRGTGLVSGGAGTQGTYTALDPEGLGVTGAEGLQSRSPGLSTKVGRRAAVHITVPTLVTVPLHITSNLALGVLQGGGGDRVIHRGSKDRGQRVEGKERGEKVERKVETGRKVEEEEKHHMGKVTDGEGIAAPEENTVAGGGGEEEGGGQKEEEKEEEQEVRKLELVMGGQSVSREQRAKSLISNAEEDGDEDAVDEDKDADVYMEMKGAEPVDLKTEPTQHVDDSVFDASDILNSSEVEGDDLGLSGYVQDNFEFLDQMDCSILDHMDCGAPYQVNEFSVEPPGHSDDEYEVMEQSQPSEHPAELQTHLQQQLGPETHTKSPTELNPHRLLSIDTNGRHTKSLSLPYMTSPVHGPEESWSDEDVAVEDSDDDDDDYSSEDDDSMFVKSLPAEFLLRDLKGFEPDTDTQDSCPLDAVPEHHLQSAEERGCQSMNLGFSACEESAAEDQEQVVITKDEESQEEEEITKLEEEDKVHHGGDQVEINKQSRATEEELSVSEDPQSDEEQALSSTHMVDITVGKEKEAVDKPLSDYPSCCAVSCVTEKDTTDALLEESRDFSVRETEQPSSCVGSDTRETESDEGERREVHKDKEDTCQEIVVVVKEDAENMWEETSEEMIADEEKMQKGVKEQESAFSVTSSEIWGELEDVVCEVIEESQQAEKKDARERREGGTMEDVREGEEEERVSGEKMVEVDVERTNKTDVRLEIVEEPVESREEKLTDPEMQQEFEEKETNLAKTSEVDEVIQRKPAANDEAQHHDTEEVVSKEKGNSDKDRVDEHCRTSVDKQIKEVSSDMKEQIEGRKCEESKSSLGGVGRKLVVSKQPKVYQVKAVPVVPPKPQHCKITALTLRQQQQQRERGEQGRDGDDGEEGRGRREKPAVRGGERERERRRDGDEGATRDTSRNSPLSMCFDEAVAIATLRRGKEKEREGEGETEGVGTRSAVKVLCVY
ncbi:LOW QUALITY PROTEIN: rho GTPase-activating protein 30 [Pempheris klunzingeri]|uniref:LOW QUALITY PROTEIN: rho GTPase-activating protein 30 n=1 Tax=Pempheris klunzingeri TaxID=3127111 RepID=UPI00397FD4F3